MQDTQSPEEDAREATDADYDQIRAEWKAIYDEIGEDEIAMSEAFLAISAIHELEPYDWSTEEMALIIEDRQRRQASSPPEHLLPPTD
jgi:hypothetical protein